MKLNYHAILVHYIFNYENNELVYKNFNLIMLQVEYFSIAPIVP